MIAMSAERMMRQGKRPSEASIKLTMGHTDVDYIIRAFRPRRNYKASNVRPRIGGKFVKGRPAMKDLLKGFVKVVADRARAKLGPMGDYVVNQVEKFLLDLIDSDPQVVSDCENCMTSAGAVPPK